MTATKDVEEGQSETNSLKAKAGEKENWLDDYEPPVFGHGDHSDEVRHPKANYSEPAGTAARAGK